MPPDKSRQLFVGNVPYGVSEEEIVEIFSRQGQVIEFRLVYDQETSKPKGYGFLTYADPECAIAAVRNLNEYPIQGRNLRVAWTSKNDGNKTTSGVQQLSGSGPDNRAALPPMPPGIENNALAAPDAISQTLSAMPPQQLLDIISQMKGMVSDNPAQVAQIFQAAPQLAYAIFQALLVLGLVDINVLGSIVQATSAPAAQPPPPQAPPSMPPQPLPQYPQPPMPGYPPFGQPPHVPTPPQHMPYQPPPPPPPPQAAAQQPSQDDLIRQVLAMSREQILALPPMQRDQLITLRAHFGAPVT